MPWPRNVGFLFMCRVSAAFSAASQCFDFVLLLRGFFLLRLLVFWVHTAPYIPGRYYTSYLLVWRTSQDDVFMTE